MNLERYNRIAIAAIATSVLLAILAIAGTIAASSLGGRQKQGIAVRHTDRPKPKQNLAVCLPIRASGSEYEYLPVAAVVANDARERPVVAYAEQSIGRSAYSDLGDHCGLNSYYGGGRVFNVVARNTRTKEERLLLHESAQVVGLQLPCDKCKEGAGEVPCGMLLWTMRPNDSNKDGVIDSDDATVAYLSDLSASKLTQVTPTDATMLRSAWNLERRTLLLEIRRDLNGNHSFTAEDGNDVIEVDIDHPAIGVPALRAETVKALANAIQ